VTDLIECSIEDGIAIMRLNRPEKHNAFTQAMHAQLGTLLDRLRTHASVRAIVLCGAGKSFCSGMDVSMIGQRAEGDSNLAYLGRLQEVRIKQIESTQPIVAALKGAVFGLGCEIAMACDIRVAADDLNLSVPEVDMGLITDSGGLPLLSAVIGPARARFLIFTGAKIDAATALSWGAVEFVTSVEAVDRKAIDIARAIASKPPLAIAAAKRILDDLGRSALRSGMSAELFAQSALFATADHGEAKRAYKADEKAVFKGR
jgi:enoyl-CoA hydratase